MSEKKNNNIVGKAKKYVYVFIPVILVVAIGWTILKAITKKTNGEDVTVGDTVKEGVAFVKRTINLFNGK